MRITVLLIGIISFSASFGHAQSSGNGGKWRVPPPRPQNTGEIEFIKAKLDELQLRSIAEDLEYCGYLGILPNGEYVVTPPTRGDNAGCLADEPPYDMNLIASYHTHAAYSYEYDSEVPSVDDVEGDIYEQVNGYIATPGGRIWFVDYRAERAIMLCDIYCVTADPSFADDYEYPVAKQYSLNELIQRQY